MTSTLGACGYRSSPKFGTFHAGTWDSGYARLALDQANAPASARPLSPGLIPSPTAALPLMSTSSA